MLSEECGKIIVESKISQDLGLYIYEFGYLIRAIMKRRGIEIDSVSEKDFKVIVKHHSEIVKAIDEELDADNMLEYGVQKEIAITNLENLKKIVNAIFRYKEYL